MTKGSLSAAMILLGVLACGSAETGTGGNPIAPPPPAGDISLGKAAFERDCASCHTSHDGFDLAYFSYADTTIIRRAVAHVDAATALQIVAYVRWLNTPHVSRGIRVFQPGGSAVASDVQFAVSLFGQDAWPSLSTAQLKAIDPLATRIAFPLPTWSDESSNLDWMPDVAPAPGILSFNGNRAATALAAYYASPTDANLLAAVRALHAADHDATNSAAPCLFNNASRVNYVACFEVRRWTSTLIAQHMLRMPSPRPLDGELFELWWDVGDAARLSVQAGSAIGNAQTNVVDWLYLGWMFDPSRHESFYLENALAGRGMPRHAVFVALRGQVARPNNSWDEHESIYDDLRQAVRHAPGSWTAGVMTFALNHILGRLSAGDRPPSATERSRAILTIDAALSDASAKVSSSQLGALQTLANQVKSQL